MCGVGNGLVGQIYKAHEIVQSLYNLKHLNLSFISGVNSELHLLLQIIHFQSVNFHQIWKLNTLTCPAA